MTDTQYEVHPEIASARAPEIPAEHEQPKVETTPEVQVQAQLEPQLEVKQQETSKEINFRQLREKAEKAERERDELLRLMQNKQQSQSQTDEDDDIRLGADDVAEGKHLSKMQSKVKKLEAQLKNYQQQSAASIAEAKIKAQYPDFDTVVSKENIEMLRTLEPELADTINSTSDIYSKAVSAYKMIKKSGIYKEDLFAGDREKAKQNTGKPRPLTSISPQQGDSPLSQANAFANGLTDELKVQLRKEMEIARKNM